MHCYCSFCQKLLSTSHSVTWCNTQNKGCSTKFRISYVICLLTTSASYLTIPLYKYLREFYRYSFPESRYCTITMNFNNSARQLLRSLQIFIHSKNTWYFSSGIVHLRFGIVTSIMIVDFISHVLKCENFEKVVVLNISLKGRVTNLAIWQIVFSYGH